MVVLRKGMRSPAVAKLQSYLNTYVTPGANLKVDGVFGSKTKAAVKSFQAAHNLVADGIVGPKTRVALERLAKVQDLITKERFMLFNGNKLHWKIVHKPGLLMRLVSPNPTLEYPANATTVFSINAVSGLKPNNPVVKELMEKGRKDIAEGVDYTQPKYQHLSGAGPIPAGVYFLNLRPGMREEKAGDGWGTGGWSLYPVDPLLRNLGFLEGRYGIDLPLVRSGFFLHEDGGLDGTAGCIGLEKAGLKKIKSYLIDYQTKGYKRIILRVKYKG